MEIGGLKKSFLFQNKLLRYCNRQSREVTWWLQRGHRVKLSGVECCGSRGEDSFEPLTVLPEPLKNTNTVVLGAWGGALFIKKSS